MNGGLGLRSWANHEGLTEKGLCHRLMWMTTPVLWTHPPRASDAAGSLRALESARSRTRLMRSDHWLVALVFGVVVLGAIPFYVTAECRRVACGRSSAPLGQAFVPMFNRSVLSNWATVYWAVAVVAGFALLVVHHRWRTHQVGVEWRLWPAVVTGVVLLGLVVLMGDSGLGVPVPGDLVMRGTMILPILALAVAIDAYLERSWTFGLFAAGFIGLALLSSLYTEINLFQRAGIGGLFSGAGHELPNLILPGAYLVLGGVGFLLGRGRTLQVRFLRSTG